MRPLRSHHRRQRVLPPRAPVPSVHVNARSGNEIQSAMLDQRADSAVTLLARIRKVSRSRLLRELVVKEFVRIFGFEPPGPTFERPRRWTDPVKRAYQNAYSAAYVRAKRAGEPMEERQRLGREAGARAALAAVVPT